MSDYAFLRLMADPCEDKSVDVSGSDLWEGRYILLPDMERYNAGYGLTSLSRNGEAMALGVDWKEALRPASASHDESSRYWTHRVRILEPRAESEYKFTWRSPVIKGGVQGLRTSGQRVLWDKPPEDYNVEIWRQCKGRVAARWLLWRTVGGVVFNIPQNSSGTYAFRFALLAPHGARTLLSPETVLFKYGVAKLR